MNQQRPTERSFAKLYENSERFVLKWGVPSLALILAIAFFLVEILHAARLPDWGEKTLYSLAILIALGTARQILGISTDVEKLIRKSGDLAKEVGAFRREVERSILSLVDDLSPGLKLLTECVESLRGEAEKYYPIDILEMDWLGLDMDRSWKYIAETVLNDEQIKRMHLRILMISPTWGYEPSWLPREVHAWRENSAKILSQIKEWLEDEIPQIRAQGRELRLEIKLYDRLPMVHGFCVKQPMRSWYISFCRWGGAKFRIYDWGETKYRKIVGDFSTQASKDYVDIFTGQFENLWRTLPTTDPAAWSNPSRPQKRRLAGRWAKVFTRRPPEPQS